MRASCVEGCFAWENSDFAQYYNRLGPFCKTRNQFGKKFLYPPVYLDVHPITPTHHHIGLVYFATAASDRVTLAADEHEAIRWFSEAELYDPTFGIQPDVLFYACDALRRAAAAQT